MMIAPYIAAFLGVLPICMGASALGFEHQARSVTDDASQSLSSQDSGRTTSIQQYSKELETEGGEAFNASFSFPTSGGVENAPVLLLLNGVSCESWEYSEFLQKLTKAGFVTIVTDFWMDARKSHFPTKPGCPDDKVVIVKTDILPPILSYLTSLSQSASEEQERKFSEALQRANTQKIVPVGHSYGGLIAIDLMKGRAPASNRIGDIEIPGAILFEGGAGQGHVAIDQSQFLVYVASTIRESDMRKYYNNTVGQKDFLVVSDCNHFGINNFHKDQKYMVAPCAQALDDKTAHFQTTQERQEKVISTVAQVTVLEILARVLQDNASRQNLEKVERELELVVKADISPFNIQ